MSVNVSLLIEKEEAARESQKHSDLKWNKISPKHFRYNASINLSPIFPSVKQVHLQLCGWGSKHEHDSE